MTYFFGYEELKSPRWKCPRADFLALRVSDDSIVRKNARYRCNLTRSLVAAQAGLLFQWPAESILQQVFLLFERAAGSKVERFCLVKCEQTREGDWPTDWGNGRTGHATVFQLFVRHCQRSFSNFYRCANFYASRCCFQPNLTLTFLTYPINHDCLEQWQNFDFNDLFHGAEG